MQAITITSGQVTVIVLLFGALQWLIAEWTKVRLEKSIQHEYDKRMEDYRFLQIKKQKAEVLAALFARWIKYRGKDVSILKGHELFDYYEDLNRMSFEIFLWIEDAELVADVMKLLHNDREAKDIRVLIGQVRKFIWPNDTLDPQLITIWPRPDMHDKVFPQ